MARDRQKREDATPIIIDNSLFGNTTRESARAYSNAYLRIVLIGAALIFADDKDVNRNAPNPISLRDVAFEKSTDDNERHQPNVDCCRTVSDGGMLIVTNPDIRNEYWPRKVNE